MMGLRRELFRTMFVQGSGAAALLLAVLCIGATLGPEAQGHFNRTKAEVEFVAALAMLGLPQALFYFVRQTRLPLPRAMGIGATVAAAGACVAWVYAALAHGPGWLAGPLFAAAVGSCVWHGQLRPTGRDGCARRSPPRRPVHRPLAHRLRVWG